jgi:5-methylcytosine-specific restriction endonuclease McrA
MKRCPACGAKGLVDELFGRRRSGGPANSYCRSCAAERTRAHYEANRGRPRTPPDPVKARARKRRYLARHRKRIYAAQRKRDRENPEAKRERVRRRRARLAGATVERVDYAKVLAEHGRVCHLCGDDIDGPIDFDHVIPIAVGGAHSYDNIRPSHASCNRRKGARAALAVSKLTEGVEAA